MSRLAIIAFGLVAAATATVLLLVFWNSGATGIVTVVLDAAFLLFLAWFVMGKE